MRGVGCLLGPHGGAIKCWRPPTLPSYPLLTLLGQAAANAKKLAEDSVLEEADGQPGAHSDDYGYGYGEATDEDDADDDSVHDGKRCRDGTLDMRYKENWGYDKFTD